MATVADIADIARNYLRDFPKFFQTNFDVVGRTYELGHPNIDKNTFWAAYYPTGASSVTELTTTQYSLDSRNGIFRLGSGYPAGTQLMIEGYYYEWLTPDDLSFYSQRAIEKHLPALEVSIEDLSDIAINAVAIAAICESLWGLMTEFSRDIDVITSESIHIPASQRFRMVQSLLGQWEAEYRRHATALNIGIDRLEVFTLRRISRTTNRLVPLYKAMEIGETTPIERLWPKIDSGVIDMEEKKEPLRFDAYIDGDPPESYVSNTTAYY